MEKLDKYRKIIVEMLDQYSVSSRSEPDVDVQAVVDKEHDHYQIMHVGWANKRRIYGCILHMDIKNQKVWIQHNGIESDVAKELLEAGVDREDIVIGFHSPHKRKISGYGVG